MISRRSVVVCFVTAAVAITPLFASAQSSTRVRMPWGDPDLQGVWDYRTITPLERPGDQADKEFLTEEEILFCNACGSPLHAAGTVNTVSVVLAEDASVSRRKIAAMLKRLGCRMTEALNGREGVDLASQVKPHLVILDLHMPEMSGMEALDAL